ncbi:hypothetical protein [Actinophytocola sp.]|uniref:hypothetical protein n=1 Tax=Actinophytocola sp. TaxID=1872138 RepID=UPI002D3D298C|nr:hypothetical protein [Actinophytocola sp.]HYQ69080.1 hypothetical protein [Actinophytocola sp.]
MSTTTPQDLRQIADRAVAFGRQVTTYLVDLELPVDPADQRDDQYTAEYREQVLAAIKSAREAADGIFGTAMRLLGDTAGSDPRP